MMKAYRSNRIYKTTLSLEIVNAIAESLRLFNRGKHYAYQSLLRRERQQVGDPKLSDYLQVQDQFGLSSYYARDAVKAAVETLKGQKELTKLNIETTKAQIKATEKKIKDTTKQLDRLRKVKVSCVKGKPKLTKRAPEHIANGKYIVKRGKEEVTYDTAYLFEHQYVDPQIKHLKARIGQLRFKLQRKQEKLERLQTNMAGAVYGTKDFYRQQHTVKRYRKHHDEWKQEFDNRRYSNMTLSGRKDSKNGNFVVRYEPAKHALYWTTNDGVEQSITNVTFPYGGDIITQAIAAQLQRRTKERLENGQSMAWRIDDHGEYYIVQCLLDVAPASVGNYCKTSGVIGVDINGDHLAMANVNSKGQLIKSWIDDFDLENHTSGQNDKIIEALAIRLVDMAVKLNKPIVLEKLDTTVSKAESPYGSHRRNRKLSMFAYRKFISAIESRAEKMGVAVFHVNPAYTSQIGKMKYMKRLGISIHQSAAYVIARRGMRFKEKLPPMMSSRLPEKIAGRHHWVHWRFFTMRASGMKVHAFYSAGVWDNAGTHGLASDAPTPSEPRPSMSASEVFC